MIRTLTLLALCACFLGLLCSCNGACAPAVDPVLGLRLPLTFEARPAIQPASYGQVVNQPVTRTVQPLYSQPAPAAQPCAPAPSAMQPLR